MNDISLTFLCLNSIFRGSYDRWYFDKHDGLCKNMNYTGCLGNKNRFMTKEACDNSCKHEAVRVQSQITCSLPKVVGQCLANEDGPKAFAKWYFDRTNKVCQPFYFSGCGGNENNFGTREECETTCPNTFPPEIQVGSQVISKYIKLLLCVYACSCTPVCQ